VVDLEKVFKGVNYLWRRYKENPSSYLEGTLKDGPSIAYRIIALFEAHDVKRTQIYRLLGEKFPDIKPTLDAKKLESLLNGEIIDTVCEMFGVKKAWVEGEAGPIYDTQDYSKNLPAFVDFVRDLMVRTHENICILTALKPSQTGNDLYKDNPDIALFFSEQIAELDDKIIYRYHPFCGPFLWDHTPTRYHLGAFLNIADRTGNLKVKGYLVSQKQISKLSDGKTIPHYRMKTTGRWNPEDYGYPEGVTTIGKLKKEDWRGLLEYFDKADESKILNSDYEVKTNFLPARVN